MNFFSKDMDSDKNQFIYNNNYDNYLKASRTYTYT